MAVDATRLILLGHVSGGLEIERENGDDSGLAVGEEEERGRREGGKMREWKEGYIHGFGELALSSPSSRVNVTT